MMKTVDDFYKKYKIEEFYEKQGTNSKNPIEPFNKKKHKKLSFGIIPGFKNYDLFYERYLSAVEILINENSIKENIRILDIGSGEAYFKFFFDSMCEEKIEWHGVEVWKERAVFCRHVGYSINEDSLEKGMLPFEDAEFDIVLASHVIEHIPNPQQILKEIGRVVKKGGFIVIGTPTKPPIIAQLDSWYHRLSNRNTGDTQQAFTHQSLEKLALKSMDLNSSNIIDKRGFRIFSSRKKLPLENWDWFYKFSIYLGKKFLFFVPEINLSETN